jgi:hypothetical protein
MGEVRMEERTQESQIPSRLMSNRLTRSPLGASSSQLSSKSGPVFPRVAPDFATLSSQCGANHEHRGDSCQRSSRSGLRLLLFITINPLTPGSPTISICPLLKTQGERIAHAFKHPLTRFPTAFRELHRPRKKELLPLALCLEEDPIIKRSADSIVNITMIVVCERFTERRQNRRRMCEVQTSDMQEMN